MNRSFKFVCVAAIVPLLWFASSTYRQKFDSSALASSGDTILLLLPDSLDAKSVDVREWLDAGAEEGLHLVAVHDSDLLNPVGMPRAAGIIIPDQLHRTANDALIGELSQYVRRGGNLMVV